MPGSDRLPRNTPGRRGAFACPIDLSAGGPTLRPSGECPTGVAIDLWTREMAYRAALQVGDRALQNSLLDFLR